jgi:hypothetical protein
MKIRKFYLKGVVKEIQPILSLSADITSYVLRLLGHHTGAKIVKIVLTVPLVTVSLISLLVIVLPWLPIILWESILEITANVYLRIIVLILLTIIAYLFYLARTFARPVYGLAEVIVGIATCWGGLSYSAPNAHPFTASLAVIGGFYIIIRGIDNMIDEKSLTESFEEEE